MPGTYFEGHFVALCAFQNAGAVSYLAACERPRDAPSCKLQGIGVGPLAPARRCAFYDKHIQPQCFANLLDHLLRSSYPGDVQSAVVRSDSSIRTTAELAFGIDLEGVALQRAHLPPSKTGLLLLLRQRGGG